MLKALRIASILTQYCSIREVKGLSKNERRAVPPPLDVQLKELKENFDKRLSAMEEQLPQLLNHRHSSSGVVIIFDKTKEKK
jgi:hypothetical protein